MFKKLDPFSISCFLSPTFNFQVSGTSNEERHIKESIVFKILPRENMLVYKVKDLLIVKVSKTRSISIMVISISTLEI